MRKIMAALLATLFLLAGCHTAAPQYNDPYDAAAAVAYSYQYVSERNPAYADFDSNCTNYISQCLVAGGKRMDEAIPPKQNVRVTYHNQKDRWFSDSIETNPARWKEFSISTSFCRTEAFVAYWTKQRGMVLTTYFNAMDGLMQLYERAEVGDIIVLYNEAGDIVHLCLIAVCENDRILLNANTVDYHERNILKISAITYPKVGLIEME